MRQRVIFHPRLAPFFGLGTARFLEGLAGLSPEKESIQKAEGLTRFYLNGKLPLVRQTFPEMLESRREVLCEKVQGTTATFVEAQLLDGRKVQVSPANSADLESLVALHLICFSERDHLALKLGPAFIRDAFRWFLTSPNTLVLVAKDGARVVGYTALSNRPYNLPMFMACKWSALLGFLNRPWLACRPDWLNRLQIRLFSRWNRISHNEAQIAFTGIAPEFQGQPVGLALKEASIQACRDWGSHALLTGVRRRNLRAKALNERFGFIEVPESSSKHLIALRLDLTPHQNAGDQST